MREIDHLQRRSGGVRTYASDPALRHDLELPAVEHAEAFAAVRRVGGQPTAFRSTGQQQACRGGEGGGPLVERPNAPVARVDDVQTGRPTLTLDACVRAPDSIAVVARERDASRPDPRGISHRPDPGGGRSGRLQQLPQPIHQRSCGHQPMTAPRRRRRSTSTAYRREDTGWPPPVRVDRQRRRAHALDRRHQLGRHRPGRHAVERHLLNRAARVDGRQP